MSAYRVNVVIPLARIEGGAHAVLHVLRIEVDRPIAWVKAHADDIARAEFPRAAYTALLVEAA